MFTKPLSLRLLKNIATGSACAALLFFSFNFKPSTHMKGNTKTLIYHKVEDFTKWKATFDGAKEFRAASGELSYEIGTLRHDPSVAYVLNEWTSAEAFQAFVSKPELGEAMKKAGVLEPPHFAVFNKTESNKTIGGKTNTLIFHQVEDFDKWKTTFTAANAFRAASGELSYEIGVFQSDPKTAYVLNEWDNAEAFQAFISKPELGEAMKKAGVLPPPTIFIFDKKAGSN